MEHIPGSQNKAADCLSRLPYITRKRNDNPLHVIDFSDIDEAASVNQVSYMLECRLCEIDLTDTAAQQLSDKHCIRIKNLMKDKSSKFPKRDRYKEEKNILYHTNIENGKEYKAVSVPKHLVPTVTKEMHDTFGHFGIGKTYSLIKRYYFWPKMIKHFQKHVENCSLCRCEKLAADKYQLQTTEISDRPFAKVSIDLIVELPRTHQGNKNVVVMVDHLTGWPLAKAIPDKEASTTADAIYEKLILEHTCPQILLSENGKEFTNDLLAYVWEQHNIEQLFISHYMPQSNGKTENFNHFLKASIRKLCQDDMASADQVIDQILLAYRCCPHTSTGEPPFFLVFNRDPTLPIHKLIKPVETYIGEKDIAKRIEQSCIILSTAAKMLPKKHSDQKKSKNHRPSKHPFQVGDLVLVKKHNKAKLELKWEPGYKITKLPTDWTAVIENQLTGNSRHFNVTDLKLKLPEED